MKSNLLSVVGALVLAGCVNGGGGVNVRELAFAGRVVLVLDGEPTVEEIRSLVDGALEIAESRGVEGEELEALRMAAQLAISLYESDGDWRSALVGLLESVEAGENE